MKNWPGQCDISKFKKMHMFRSWKCSRFDDFNENVLIRLGCNCFVSDWDATVLCQTGMQLFCVRLWCNCFVSDWTKYIISLQQRSGFRSSLVFDLWSL